MGRNIWRWSESFTFAISEHLCFLGSSGAPLQLPRASASSSQPRVVLADRLSLPTPRVAPPLATTTRWPRQAWCAHLSRPPRLHPPALPRGCTETRTTPEPMAATSTSQVRTESRPPVSPCIIFFPTRFTVYGCGTNEMGVSSHMGDVSFGISFPPCEQASQARRTA